MNQFEGSTADGHERLSLAERMPRSGRLPQWAPWSCASVDGFQTRLITNIHLQPPRST